MTNKTNEATVKDGLPIANALLRLKEEFDSVGTKFNGLTWQGIEKAMQSYSDQQNAELDKMAEQLSAENSHLSSIIEGLKIDKEWLSERVKELESGETELQELFELRVKVKELEVTISKALEYVSKGLYFLAGAELEKCIENVLKKKAQDENKNNIQEDPRSSS